MRSLIFATVLMTASTAQFAAAETKSYELDPTHTAVVFTVAHIDFADTLGIFGEVAGTFNYDMENQTLSDVAVTIQADSVNTFLKSRDEHVTNKDFLDVKNHPEITFTASAGAAANDTSGTVTGDLTILGQTQPVTLDVTLNKAAAYPFGHKRFVLGLSLETVIKRSDFGMEYGVANGLVGDEVAIKIETEAMQME